MSACVTRKRAREESTAEEQSPIPKRSDTVEPELHEEAVRDGGGQGAETKRDEEFWLEDGTVILVARDVEFRVYSGILASHSPVFRDLFAQDHPTCNVSMNGKYDIPCPVVQLSDSPEELRHLLRAYMPALEGSSRYIRLNICGNSNRLYAPLVSMTLRSRHTILYPLPSASDASTR